MMYSKDKACSSFQTITSNVHNHSITTSCIIFILLTIIPLLLAFTNNPNLCNNQNNPNNQNINALFQAINVQTLKPISRAMNGHGHKKEPVEISQTSKQTQKAVDELSTTSIRKMKYNKS